MRGVFICPVICRQQLKSCKGNDRTSNDPAGIQRAGGSCEARMPGARKKPEAVRRNRLEAGESRTQSEPPLTGEKKTQAVWPAGFWRSGCAEAPQMKVVPREHTYRSSSFAQLYEQRMKGVFIYAFYADRTIEYT